jgi:hypothetical protein
MKLSSFSALIVLALTGFVLAKPPPIKPDGRGGYNKERRAVAALIE